MRVVFYFRGAELLQSPRLRTVHLFQGLITEGIVDINVLLASWLTVCPELCNLLSDIDCIIVKGAVGVIGYKNIAAKS